MRFGRIIEALSGPRIDELPNRVRAAIARQQDESEILIGWIQLAVVLTFAALYFIAPKPDNPEVDFQPVPFALSGYLVFTVVRLGAAYRVRLAGWFLALSVVADIGLLMTTIWSFHIQYMQPPSFYLKVPTLLYIFIFIALRALRFEARYVVLAGVTAAIGWLTLAWYAVTFAPGPTMVTRDYVYYMTHNSILLGAEFDKVISILLVTTILAVAITRARRLLVRAVTEGAAARDLSRFFDAGVARQITGAETEIKAGQGVVREAAILNVDVRGFSKLAARIPANDLMQLLAEYQKRVVPLIQAAGGTIDKFMGDGIMATFGATQPSETATADALRAIDAVMSAAAEWRAERAEAGEEPLAVGAALATGRVVCGAVGDATRLEYTVIGDAVNLSAKLEKQNKVERVRALTTRETLETGKVQGYRPPVEHEIRPGRAIEGVEGSFDLVVLAP
jgi:adenylate cyclase